jgi:hypothetical protein
MMSWTEDDTFNVLRRVPFREVFISILDPCVWGEDIVPEDRHPKIREAGWEVDEFMSMVLSEMSKETITCDTVRLESPRWREHYLRTGPV